MNKLCDLCGQSLLRTPLPRLFDMLLHDVVNLRERQKSEELQVPPGQKIKEICITHLILSPTSFKFIFSCET